MSSNSEWYNLVNIQDTYRDMQVRSLIVNLFIIIDLPIQFSSLRNTCIGIIITLRQICFCHVYLLAHKIICISQLNWQAGI